VLLAVSLSSLLIRDRQKDQAWHTAFSPHLYVAPQYCASQATDKLIKELEGANRQTRYMEATELYLHEDTHTTVAYGARRASRTPLIPVSKLHTVNFTCCSSALEGQGIHYILVNFVTTLWAGRAPNRGSVVVAGQIFSPPKRPDWLWSQSRLQLNEHWRTVPWE
jgi:hypothetical protein